MTIHEYVQTLRLESPLSELLKRINNRYVVFGYKGNKKDHRKRGTGSAEHDRRFGAIKRGTLLYKWYVQEG